MNERKIRNQKGAAVTGLVLALFFFVMLIGFFCFDSSRIQMAQRELTATCDSASLAGTAMLTSYDTSNDDTNHTKLQNAQTLSCQYARNMFQAGNLLGQGLENANVVSTYAAVGVVGSPASTNVMISLADPTNNYQGVPPGPTTCVNGKAIMCYACYAYQPVFLWIVGVTTVGLNAASGGGLPQVDAVMVFDYSGSMDDATNVSLVRRTWDSTIGGGFLNAGAASIGQIDYQMLVSSPPTFGIASGSPYPGTQNFTAGHGTIHYIEVTPAIGHRMSDYVQFNYSASPNGMAWNVLPPQNLDQAGNTFSQATPLFLFDQNLRTNVCVYKPGVVKSPGPVPNNIGGTAYQSDYGTPPGNCTLAPPYGYGQFWMPTLASQTMITSPPANATMAYRTDSLNPHGMGPFTYGPGPNPFISTLPNYCAYDYTSLTTNREFTDVVVNIADPGTWPYTQPLSGPSGSFVGFSVTFPAQEPDSNIAGNTYNFEDLGVLVEAARGNLNNVGWAKGALLDRGCYWTVFEDGKIKQSSAVGLGHVAPGYQEAYQRLAMLYSQPIATALDGADGGFFQKVNSLCDCRFGFVGFSNADNLTVGNSANSKTVGTAQNITAGSTTDSFYLSVLYTGSGLSNYNIVWNGNATSTGANNGAAIAGGVGNGFRTPRRAIKKSETQANSVNGVDGCRLNSSFSGGVTAGFSSSWNLPTADANGIENGQPIDNTDTYEAINTARYMFLDPANYDITNISTSRPAAKHAIVFFSDGVPTGGVGGTDAAGALSVAQACKGDGIAIYAIGMDVTNNAVLQSAQISFMGNGSTGLAGASGNGGRFFQCTSASTVKQAFNAVARRLAQSQR
jgi:hypothetical protein